ncbi:MAG: sigma-54-dependent Fis family transcriptional regulator [Alphaproteobacteria bacterium]|nr:sigma-54-dependent Fis family transcriptional regulator [Alphaproteobacteria bacterium]NCQ88027.1 sigma-54-dependent Fis family transcriptional regulator [Alphaproteobacteria bacterium]NCT05466.1 sigma-54-dependent Fis family transcriptional regulator [Alphaproteobacteria bacterium]
MSSDILVIDDEKDIRLLIKGILEDEGYHVREASNSNEAHEQFVLKKPDLVILDIWLQESIQDGLEILTDFKAQSQHLPVVMISGHGTIETAVTAIKQGAYDFIEKPFKSDRLLLMISRAIETANLKKENAALKARMDLSADLIGTSPEMTALKQLLTKIAPTKSRVMIKGEAGVGKEVVAREIHRLSDRHNKPFMALNCAVMHPERLEEELFGYERDGVVCEGVLEKANGGTLLLDEVADMPLETQGKILRVLQDNQIHHLGSQEPIDIDVRILASTNRDLDAAIEKGDFREDLFYRLNVVPLDIIPLRDRPKDIKVLMEYFIEEYVRQTGQAAFTLSKKAQTALNQYQWPGNVRQLKNMVEWLMIMASTKEDAGQIEEDDLPPEISGKEAQGKSKNNAIDYSSLALREAREAFEKSYLQNQVTRFKGNVSKTAEFVGMERSALHRKLKALDISLNAKQDSDESNDSSDNSQKRKSA